MGITVGFIIKNSSQQFAPGKNRWLYNKKQLAHGKDSWLHLGVQRGTSTSAKYTGGLRAKSLQVPNTQEEVQRGTSR